MAGSPLLEAGQVPHPAFRGVQGDGGWYSSTCENHIVTQVNAAGIPVVIMYAQYSYMIYNIGLNSTCASTYDMYIKKYRLQELQKPVCLHFFPGYLRQRNGPKQRASGAPVIYTS